MAFSDFKNLSMRTKYIEHDEYYGYQRGLASVVYNFWKMSATHKGTGMNSENQQSVTCLTY